MTNRRANFVNMVDHLTDVPQKDIKKEIDYANNGVYRQKYHIESESGSLGDPNGFSFFNGKYHLFYQWSPLAFSKSPHYTQHGWKHLISKDLVHWKDLGAGIESDSNLDKYGTYSGSALAVDGKLFIMYTGNTWTNTESEDDWQRVPYQVGAAMDKNNHVKKNDFPYITGPLRGYTGHFRDPKLFKKDDNYYAVLGIQRKNLTGSALLIGSPDLKNWQIINEIKCHHDDFGYMWECPDYYELKNKGILEFCPQGLPADENRYQNIYQNGYLIGEPLNLKNGDFNCGDFHELDKGFDFYAMQTMQDKKGRRILMAWMGLPEIHYPTEKDHYTGCMIFPRELTLSADQKHLLQNPVSEIDQLHCSHYKNKFDIDENAKEIPAGLVNSRDIKLELDCQNTDNVVLDLFANSENTQSLKLIFSRKKQRFIVDRSHSGVRIAEEYGVTRSCFLDLSRKIEVRILQDVSSCEIFLNNGQNVFSMRVFPLTKQNKIFIKSLNGKANLKYDIYQLSEDNNDSNNRS